MNSELLTVYENILVRYNVEHDEKLKAEELDVLLQSTPKLVNMALRMHNRRMFWNKLVDYFKR